MSQKSRKLVGNRQS